MSASWTPSRKLRALSAAACFGELTEKRVDELETLLRDPRSRRWYRNYCLLQAELWFLVSADRADDAARRRICREAEMPASSVLARSSDSAAPLSAAHGDSSPVVVFPSATLPGALGYFSDGMPLAYLIATVVTGLGLLIGSLVHVAGPEEVARQSASLPSLPAVVGRITGMVDCKWEKKGLGIRDWGLEEGSRSGNQKSRVALGDRFPIASGLLEITYNTGAKVILQGPATYSVDANGGYLAVGKLTGKLETRGERRGERGEEATNHQISNPKSQIWNPSLLSPLLSPLFVIRTPTATLTDLGTEFGVEVGDTGATQAQVFQGAVELRVVGPDSPRPSTVLRPEHGAALVTIGKDHVPALHYTAAKPGAFVRQIGKRQQVPIRLFNTGIHVAEGQPDPHWQVAVGSYDKKGTRSTPRQALVSSVTGDIEGVWLANDPGQSQWISTVGDAARVRGDVIYTFSTTFELAGVRPETARLGGWFYVDNHVRAIRLNGREMRVPEHPYEQAGLVHSFNVRRGFVSGTNTLEFDVENGPGPSPYFTPNPMGLRVELEGTVWQESSEESAATPANVPQANGGKEG